MCYVLSKATDRQPGSLNPGFPKPIRKMRPFRYRFATEFRNANFNMGFINNLRISPRKTVHFSARLGERIRTVLPGVPNLILSSVRRKPDKTGHFRTKKGEVPGKCDPLRQNLP